MFTKKNIYLFIYLFFINMISLVGQTFSQDAEGNSTIFTESKNLQLDLTNNIANFTYYDYFKSEDKEFNNKDTVRIFGLELKGKEKDGIANLFSGDNLNADASIKTLLGVRYYTEKNTKISKKDEKLFNKLEKVLDQKNKKLISNLKNLVKGEYIDTTLFRSFRKRIRSLAMDSLEIEWKELKETNYVELNNRKIDTLEVNDFLRENDNKYIGHVKKWKELYEKENQLKMAKIPSYHQIFLRAGVIGTSFKHDLANTGTTIEQRFVDENFYGWNLELGYNIQKNDKNFWGFSYKYEYTSNVDKLEILEFNLVTIDTTITNGQFSSSSKIKALSGDYETFNQYSFNLDYIRIIPISTSDENPENKKKAASKKEPSNLFLTINPYFRYEIPCNTRLIQNNVIVGIGINAFNSKKQKIMGGIFAQFDSAKDKRFRIGLIARFNFSGLNLETKTEE